MTSWDLRGLRILQAQKLATSSKTDKENHKGNSLASSNTLANPNVFAKVPSWSSGKGLHINKKFFFVTMKPKCTPRSISGTHLASHLWIFLSLKHQSLVPLLMFHSATNQSMLSKIFKSGLPISCFPLPLFHSKTEAYRVIWDINYPNSAFL